MGDRRTITIEAQQYAEILRTLTAFNNALWAISEKLTKQTTEITKWQSLQKEAIEAGFEKVAQAVANSQPLPQPQPQMKGTVMADYQIPDDQPDGRVTFHLAATDAEGQPITDPAALAKLTFETVNSNEAAFAVTLDADQPDPLNRVGGYHTGAPGQGTVTGNIKDADGNIIGTGTDAFTVTTGKVALGSSTAVFDGLTPIGG